MSKQIKIGVERATAERNVLFKLDEIARDLRECGYMEGDSTYDSLINLRRLAADDFGTPNVPPAYQD